MSETAMGIHHHRRRAACRAHLSDLIPAALVALTAVLLGFVVASRAQIAIIAHATALAVGSKVQHGVDASLGVERHGMLAVHAYIIKDVISVRVHLSIKSVNQVLKCCVSL